MQPFGFVSPRRTLFGRNCRHEAAAFIARLGARVVLVRSRSVPWALELAHELEAMGLAVTEVLAQGEPTIDELRAHLEVGRDSRSDSVVAVGGGSSIDLGKALAGLLPGDSDPLDHLEIVGAGQPIIRDPLPLVAIPTTSGTGAEATKNAVIAVAEHGLKVSLRDARMIPDMAIVDPALTDGAPKAITLATGLDAITQLIESYLSIRATPVTDSLCRDGIPMGITALRKLMQDDDPGARDAMALASHLSGLALANSGLGVVHGLAAVIGARGGAHGAICGRLLPTALEINEAVVRQTGRPTERFDQVRAWLADGLGVEAGTASQALRAFVNAHDLPTLDQLGCKTPDYEAIANAALSASSTKANPVQLSCTDVVAILERA